MVLLGLLAPSWGCAAAAPLPERVQPLAGGADSHAFLAAAHQSVPYDLAAQGYVEEEFLIAGTAGVYDWPGDAAPALWQRRALPAPSARQRPPAAAIGLADRRRRP